MQSIAVSDHRARNHANNISINCATLLLLICFSPTILVTEQLFCSWTSRTDCSCLLLLLLHEPTGCDPMLAIDLVLGDLKSEYGSEETHIRKCAFNMLHSRNSRHGERSTAWTTRRYKWPRIPLCFTYASVSIPHGLLITFVSDAECYIVHEKIGNDNQPRRSIAFIWVLETKCR